MNKDEKLNRLIELAKLADTLTNAQAKQFVELLVSLGTKQKEELVKSFDNFSTESYAKIQEAISTVSQKHADALLEVRQLTNKQRKEHETRTAELQLLLSEIKSIEVQDGLDGKDGVDGKDGKDGKDGSPDTREQIVEKINSGKEKDTKIEAKQITGLPDFTREVIREVGSGFIETSLKDASTGRLLSKDASGAWLISASGGGTWGSITGTLSDQTDLQSALDLKAPLTSPTFATSITGSYLTASEMLITDGSKNIVSAPVATYPSLTELTYLKGVTSVIQTQIDGKIDGTMVSTRIPYGSDANTLQTSANLTFDGNQLIVETDSSGVIPAIIRSSTSSQTASLLEVRRYDASPGLTVSATTEVTLGGAYDYVNAKHASQHIVRYAGAGAYSGKGLKINDMSSGGIVRLHALSSNSIYFTNDTGSAVPITYATWSNPSDGTSFSSAAGQWYISSGKLGVNHIWWGYAQLEATSTSQPQIGAVYDINNYMTIQVASDGATTLNAIGTGAGFTFSDSVALGTNSLTMTGSIAATGARVTKGWFTDIESTNMPTVGGTAILTSLTSPQFTTIELGHASDTTLSRVSAGVIAVEGVTVPTISSTSTLTNKRITKRVVTTTDDATAVIDVDVTDVYELSAVANATTFSTTGTPTDGQPMIIRFKDAGVAKGLTWDAVFVAIGCTLPTTTVAGKWHYIMCQYNTAATKWHALSAIVQA